MQPNNAASVPGISAIGGFKHELVFRWPLANPAAFATYFAEEGYVVLRGAVPKELCGLAVAAFEREVRPSRAYFRRHESSAFERHVFTEAGFMKYPIMNIQDLVESSFASFRQHGLDLLTQPSVRSAMAILLGEPGRMIHTMYFDGNQKTWAHRDCHYIDSEQTGRMIGVWVAAEDIHPGAGPFYVYARSHRTPTPPELALDQIDPNGAEYKQRIAEFAAGSSLRVAAPELQCGDALLWSSLTIHGSLATTAPDHSRRSFTAHYIPFSDASVGHHGTRSKEQRTLINGVDVILHGDHSRTWLQTWTPVTRAHLQSRIPWLYRGLRAIKRHALG